ncbi:unnamed protein product [Sympodiomycopsis kandeliae]
MARNLEGYRLMGARSRAKIKERRAEDPVFDEQYKAERCVYDARKYEKRKFLAEALHSAPVNASKLGLAPMLSLANLQIIYALKYVEESTTFVFGFIWKQTVFLSSVEVRHGLFNIANPEGQDNFGLSTITKPMESGYVHRMCSLGFATSREPIRNRILTSAAINLRHSAPEASKVQDVSNLSNYRFALYAVVDR